MAISIQTGRMPMARQKQAAFPLKNTLVYIICVIVAFSAMFPFFWTISSSLKQPSEIVTFPPTWIPAIPQWHNYVRVFEMVTFGTWVLNSVYVTVLTTLGVVISATVVAFSFARFEYRGRDLLFIITLGTMMMPAQVTLIPQYLLFNKLRWLNTYKPLWIPAWFGGGGFFIFLLRQFIMSLPKDLDEAAFIDGASYFRILWSILVPLCKPVLSTVAVVSFIGSWNDYMGPLIYLNERPKFTLSLGLDALKWQEGTESSGEPTFQFMMAACVMAIIPCVLLFFVAQRYFVQGIVMSGIKG